MSNVIDRSAFVLTLILSQCADSFASVSHQHENWVAESALWLFLTTPLSLPALLLPPPVINMLTQHLGSTKLFFVVQLELQGYIKCTLGVTRDRPLYVQTWVSNTANYRGRPGRAGVDGRSRNMMYVLRPLPLVNRWKGGEAYLETKTP